jgi:hypothetical protein
VQSDEAFVAACGYGDSPSAARLALALRKDFAKYGRLKPQTIIAEMTVVESGVFHPTDSIDLLEYTLLLEHLTGAKFEPEEVVEHLTPEREDLLIREWVRRVVSLTSAKGGITSGARKRAGAPCLPQGEEKGSR